MSQVRLESHVLRPGTCGDCSWCINSMSDQPVASVYCSTSCIWLQAESQSDCYNIGTPLQRFEMMPTWNVVQVEYMYRSKLDIVNVTFTVSVEN